jgi:hypothetical protein
MLQNIGLDTLWAIFHQRHLVTLDQGNYIGRNFAHWPSVYFEKFFGDYRSSPHFWLLFPTVKVAY